MDRMPTLFIGHGSPMNAIEDNRFSDTWKKLGKQLPKPQAILSVSAHWFTNGTLVTNDPAPKMIYDMYGFPDALYKVQYNAPGSPRFAARARELIGEDVQFDTSWGLDHGSWSVLRRLFPQADIPVFQLSVDKNAAPEAHFAIGRMLRPLREEGVLILGSGNIVHNLSKVNWQMDGGYPWAEAFDGYIRDAVVNRNTDAVLHYQQAGDAASLSFRWLDHYAPMLYALGAADASDRITIWNEACTMGSMSMTSYLFGM